MGFDETLLGFLQRPLMCIIAAVDAEGRPAAGRGIGFELVDDRETIDLIFSAWQWPRIEGAIRQRGRLAVTFASPSDYVTYQIKGAAAIRDTEPRDFECAERFIAKATRELTALGVPPPIIEPWLALREPKVARLVSHEIYVQTPGPKAGMLAGSVAR